MNHIIDLDQQADELYNLFEKITEGNSIAFLGAGASIGEKKYLSSEIIQYYESYLGKNYNEPDITSFVDILSADQSFDRNHFDLEVMRMLQKYKVTEGHKIMASIEWREIITTNYDLIIENAFDDIKATSNHAFDLIPIREHRDYNYKTSNTEIKYIKLNGCMSDKKRYPFVFSSDDFKKSNKFYKVVLNDLRDLSGRISLFAFGYSFRDPFGRKLLEKYDSYNFRERKWIFNIDPYPNENALPYYTQNRICIVKSTFEDFFGRYREWREAQLESIVKKKRISFTNTRNKRIKIPNCRYPDL